MTGARTGTVLNEPRATIAASEPPYRACLIEGADHFLVGRTSLGYSCAIADHLGTAWRGSGNGRGRLFPTGSSAALLVIWGFIDRNARAVAVWICQPSDIAFAGHLQRFRAINRPTRASCFMQCNQTLSGCIAPFVLRRSQAQPLHR